MRDYGKVHTSFWTSSNIRAMSDDGRALALYLLTCPHGTIAGVFRLPNGYVCEDLQWDSERVTKGFVELFANGFANRCETTKWVFICKHFQWNPPENPNQKKAAMKCAALVPSECIWKAEYTRVLFDFLGIETVEIETVSEGLPKGSLTSNSNSKQEVNTYVADKSATVQQIAQVKPPCPADTIIALYHELMPLNPAVKVLNEARRKTIRARWKEASELDCAPFGYTDREGGIAAWRQFFEVCAESDFLTGKAPAQQGKPPFIADIDFLMSPSGFAKCLENKYHREAA